MAKRALDIALALALLPFAMPVLAIAALAVRLDSPGPAFFRQERVGRHRKPFRLLKIRTIGDLASKTEAELLACPNFGQTSLQELKGKLADLGLKLKPKGA